MALLLTSFLTIPVLLLGVVSTNPIPNSDWYSKNGILCHKCPPGTHVDEHCTANGTNSSCIPCEVTPHPTFNTMLTQSKRCEKCSECDASSKFKILAICTPINDTICTCMDGYVKRNVGADVFCQLIDYSQMFKPKPDTSDNENTTSTTTHHDLPPNNITKHQPECSNCVLYVSDKLGLEIGIPVVIIALVLVGIGVCAYRKRKTLCVGRPADPRPEEYPLRAIDTSI